MGQVGDLLPPLQQRCLPLRGVADPSEFDQKTPQAAHVGPVRFPVVVPELEHLLERDRRQVQRHRLQIQLDHPFTGRHRLPGQRVQQIRRRLGAVRRRMYGHSATVARVSRQLAQDHQDRRANHRVERDRNAVFARPRQASLPELVDEKLRQIRVRSVAHPRPGQFREVVCLRQLVKNTSREQFDHDFRQLLCHFCIDPLFGFQNSKEPLLLQRSGKRRIRVAMAPPHVIGQENRHVVEEEQQRLDPISFPRQPIRGGVVVSGVLHSFIFFPSASRRYPPSNPSDGAIPQHAHILRLASEIIARSVENMKSSLPDLTDTEVVKKFLALDSELHFMSMLNKLNATDRTKSKHKNYILVFTEEEDDPVEVLAYPNATNALRALFALERDKPRLDAVLVKGDTTEDIREAFKNYFSDARNFIELIEAGCTKLSGHVVVTLGVEDDDT